MAGLRLPNRDKPAATRIRAVKSVAALREIALQDMSKLVPQRAVDLRGMLHQPRVQRNQFLAMISAAGGGFETGIPFNAKFCCDSFRA